MKKMLLASLLLSAAIGCQNAQQMATRREATGKSMEAAVAASNGDTKTKIRLMKEALEISPEYDNERHALAVTLWCDEGEVKESRSQMSILLKSDDPRVVEGAKVFLERTDEFLKKHPNQSTLRQAAIDSCKMPPSP